MTIEVIYVYPGSVGYHPVTYMAELAAELFEAELFVLHPRPLKLKEKIASAVPRRRRGVDCLMICPQPAHLGFILQIENWRRRYGRIVAWVFDSFWTNNVQKYVRNSRIFDHIFVAEQEDLTTWKNIVRAPVDWLPWGSDALRLGSGQPERPVDLLRFGRQPESWDDDAATAAACAARNLNFRGRPPTYDDPGASQRALMKSLSESKFTLSFSNRVSPSAQTHPDREYITARWTDALSTGATVAGIPPRSDTVRTLLWDEALLDLGTADQADGLSVLERAVKEWSPARARHNYLRSLEALDWRWRFEQVAAALRMRSAKLDAELNMVRERIKTG